MSENIFDNQDNSQYEFIFKERLNLVRLSKRKKSHQNDDYDEYDDSFLPNQPGIIVKTTFVLNEEMNRKFPNKTYYDYDPDTFDMSQEKKDKRAISAIVKEYLIEYIKTHQALNDYFSLTEKSIVKKSGVVKYNLKFTDYVDFNIAIDPKDLDVDDVSTFVLGLSTENLNEGLSGKESSKGISSEPWKVELSKSSRAACRTCREKIAKGEIRIGEPSLYEGHVSFKWYHLNCVKKLDENNLQGLSDLSPEEQDLVKAKFTSDKSKSKSSSGQVSKTSSKKSSKIPREIITDIISEFEDADGLTAERDIYQKAKDYNLKKDEVKTVIEEMEEEGSLYHPDQGKVKLI